MYMNVECIGEHVWFVIRNLSIAFESICLAAQWNFSAWANFVIIGGFSYFILLKQGFMKSPAALLCKVDFKTIIKAISVQLHIFPAIAFA